MMSDVDQTCRICRGEATTSQPLIHPCKCRGSIKFIHQDCLLEWLNHSNNKEKRCDICNTAYQFKTIYDPEMPSRMPSSEIYHKLVSMVKNSVVKNTSIMLYCICIIQLSIFWKFVGRVFTYVVDEKISLLNVNMLHTLLYGAYATHTRNGVLLDSPEASLMDKFQTFLVNTFVHGNLQVIIFTMVLVVIFIEHEWVIREEGYKVLLLRQMGKRPRVKLSDLLAQLAQNDSGENEQNEPNEMMINRALEDLCRVHDAYVHEDALRAAIEQGHFDMLLPGAMDNVPRNRLPNPNLQADAANAELVATLESNAEDAADSTSSHETPTPGDNGLLVGEEPPEPLHGSEENLLNLNNQNIRRINPLNDFSDNEEVDELEERRDMMQEELDAAEIADNGNLWEVLGFKLDIITPIQLAIFADIVIVTFLLAAYLCPHTIGKFALQILAIFLLVLNHVFMEFCLRFPGLNVLPGLFNYVRSKVQLPSFLELILKQLIVEPISGTLDFMANNTSLSPPTLVGRIVAVSAGYIVICLAFHHHMSLLTSGPKPIMGRSRKIYETMFRITATAKVFTIFASEIVLFPLYCGCLLDFCIAPLINKEIVSSVQGRLKLHLLTTPFESLGLYTRCSVYWLLGTFYMFCVALFVSMIRRNILRPGVLYFIKSPEDPNARLIHDAIVKPIFLQISKILLSAKVYTAFVVLGIGSVTWGIRFMVNPPFSNGSLLPIQVSSLYELFAVVCTAWVLFSVKALIAKQVLLFWKRSFAVLSHKFRLSHFLLDEPVPQERGYVVYRSFFHKLLSIGTPDYSKPVSYSEAQELFKSDANASAYFVPDGTYIRAPSSDDNSRKFLRSLFVPVTKSDQLINPMEPQAENEESDWWDDNVFYENSYTIVYTPPNNRIRCLALVCMVILFGELLIVSIGLTAALIGRPIVCSSVIVSRHFLKGLVSTSAPSETYIDWKYLDVYSLCAGLITLAQAVFLMDYRPNSTEMREFVVNQGRRAAPVISDFITPIFKLCKDVFFVNFHNIIIGEVYFGYIPEIERYFFGHPTIQLGTNSLDMKFSWPGVILNVALLPFTIIPLLLSFYYKKNSTTETWLGFLFQMTSPQTLSSLGYLLLHKVFLVTAETNGVTIDHAQEVYLCIGVLLALSITHTIISARQFLNSVNEQIRNEKYVRGTAIQNVDVSD